MIYSTYILVHPRTQQLQNVLTLEDYHQIQALLEYCLQRQQVQQENLLQQQRHEHENREHARLVQALHNNKLLQLDYRRQRAAQIQRLMRQHQQQLDQYDRARLVAALEKQRAQQAFRRFIQHHYQPQSVTHHEPVDTGVARQQMANESHQHQQQQSPPAQIHIDKVPDNSTAKDDIDDTTATTGSTEQGDQQQEEQDEQVDDAYEAYQTQQLENLLKHIFEKNTKAQQQQQPSDADNDGEEEYAFAPSYRHQQDDPEDEQTMADLLPILNDANRHDNDVTPPIPPASMQQQQQQQQQQPAAKSDDMEEDEEEEDHTFLPDNVLPLQDVVDDLVRIPTPAAPAPASTPPPPPVPVPKPAAPKEEDSKERRDKLEQLATIETTLDRLSTANQADGTTHLPLQYQMNDQGGLFLDGNTPNNRKFLMLEDDIIRCMLQLDQILSDGDPLVRDRRRAIVKKAESLLEPLDQHKQAEWKKEMQRQQQQLMGKDDGITKKKKHHRRHGKRKVHVPVTA